MRRLTVLLLLMVAATGLPALAGAHPVDTIPPGAERATIVKALDGDTIRVSVNGKGRTVRLVLIDAPETRDPNVPVECFGEEAAKRLRRMLPKGRVVYLEKDVSDKDRTGRSLRYVWFKGVKGGVFLANEIMVWEGYAALATVLPDVKHIDRIRAMEQDARADDRGLWLACGGVDTPLTVASAPEPAPAPPIADCSAFASFEEAQVYYAANPGATDLDPNGDGRACEVWFGVDAVPTASTSGESGGGAVSCADFATWWDAQAYYDASGGNYVDNLDADYDGTACEDLYWRDVGSSSSDSGSSDGDSSADDPTGGGGQAGFGGFDGVDYDCSSFGWDQAAATAYFLGDGGSAGNNVDGLDDNHNGVACEPGEG